MTERDKILEVAIDTDEDVILARQKVRTLAQEMGFSMLNQTRLITAVSELARNIVVHAGSGTMAVYPPRSDERRGMRIVFQDKGPGIPDVDQAMVEGFSTAGSMGLGLKGSQRLVDDFRIDSAPGVGTTVEIGKWL